MKRFLPEKTHHASNREGRAICGNAGDGVVTVFFLDIDCTACLVELDRWLEQGTAELVDLSAMAKVRYDPLTGIPVETGPLPHMRFIRWEK